jgi:hypothetical protein
VAIWETEYLQQLGSVTGAHTVRAFTASVVANLVTDHLLDAEQAAFLRPVMPPLPTIIPCCRMAAGLSLSAACSSS